jgi:rRNA maturation RNase YbeY
MRIEINNRQRRRVNRRKMAVLTRLLMARLHGPEGVRRWAGIGIILTDDDGIRAFNQATFASTAVTDVISCAYEPLPGEVGQTGELVLNVERAATRTCRRTGWSPAHELALYLAHGCNHLAGEEDGHVAGYRRMRRRELRCLREPAIRSRVRGLLP